ncbi:hypothetical protein ACJJTC_015099, partial [Scirpophaga incertulas]
MEIPIKKKSYLQKYRKEWEDNSDFKGWLSPVQGTDLKGMCRWCQTEFFAKISDIKKHSQSIKHKSKAEIIIKQKPLPPFLPVDKIKPSSRAEAAMALFIAEHCSVVTVEHLGEMCKKLFSDSKCGHDIHIHRTKCSEIINEVLGPHFTESLRLDIGDQKFSLILDESTDISVLKYLGIAIRYFTELLHAMFEDGSNLLYMTYIQSILGEVQTALKVFESENADPTKLLETLAFLLRSICNRVIYSHTNINVLTTMVQENHLNPYATLGYAFETSIRKLNLNEDVTNIVKQRCIDFTVKLIRELQSRLPPNIEILTKMNKLSVNEVLRTKNQNDNIIDLAKELGIDDVQTLEKIDLQWNNINFVKWQNINSTLEFWAEVNQYKNAAGNKPFQELCDLALTVISLPHSNAEIERIFSAMNMTKSKLRNRMSLKSLNSILMIKYSLKRTNKTCYNYEIPFDVLKNIGTNKAYSFAKCTSQPQASTSGIDSSSRTDTLTISDFQIL